MRVDGVLRAKSLRINAKKYEIKLKIEFSTGLLQSSTKNTTQMA